MNGIVLPTPALELQPPGWTILGICRKGQQSDILHQPVTEDRSDSQLISEVTEDIAIKSD